MTQLTAEQILEKALAALQAMGCNDTFQSNFAEHLRRGLKPLPSYGEIFQNAKYEFNKQYATWDDLGENRKSAIEAAAQAVIRAFVEREVKPIYVGVNPDSTTVTNAGIVLDSLEKLIARVEG